VFYREIYATGVVDLIVVTGLPPPA
jgi:hypothetical protein